jgi:hypothetical protein
MHIRENIIGQASRLISTGRLNGLLHLHLRPINLVVSQEPSGGLHHGKPNLGRSFTLRCFQRLSLPDIDTEHCRWHDNSYTSGPSVPVLSY